MVVVEMLFAMRETARVKQIKKLRPSKPVIKQREGCFGL